LGTHKLKNKMKNCTYCGKRLQQKETESNSTYRYRIFCNLSCSTSHQHKVRKEKTPPKPTTIQSLCEFCNTSIELRLLKRGNYSVAKCPECIRTKKLEKRGVVSTRTELRTKGELFGSSKNWQSARSTIRKNAASILQASKQKPECKVCGYAKYVEVCHIKSVSEFTDDALLGEINSLDNLVYLCPNHHWEFDNNGLDIG
jgi:hypothetical protein